MDDAPDRYRCPISLEVMQNPICVVHGNTVGRYDKRSLELHAQTEHRNRNPMTNEEGFCKALRMPDHVLREEIEQSRWAQPLRQERGDLVGDSRSVERFPFVGNPNELFEAIIMMGAGVPRNYNYNHPYETMQRNLHAVPQTRQGSGVSGTMLLDALQSIFL